MKSWKTRDGEEEERRSSPLVVPEGMTRSAYKKQLRRERNQARWKEKKRLKKEKEEAERGEGEKTQRSVKSLGLTTHTRNTVEKSEKG